MNIKLYTSVWARHQRIYGRTSVTMTSPYIRRFGHVIDEYTCPIFVGCMAKLTNIGGTARIGTAHLYSLVNR
jgi:hypothetical protein